MKVLHRKTRQQAQSARHQNQPLQSPQSAKFIVVTDGNVVFHSQSHSAAWAFITASGCGEIYRKRKLIE